MWRLHRSTWSNPLESHLGWTADAAPRGAIDWIKRPGGDAGDGPAAWPEPSAPRHGWTWGAPEAKWSYGHAVRQDAEPWRFDRHGSKRGCGHRKSVKDSDDGHGVGSDGVPEPSPNPILPDFEAARFKDGAPIDNPYFPLQPGSIYTYGATIADEEEPGEVSTERNDVTVTFETKDILGIATSVVRDTAYEDNVLVEDTLDWYAQDTKGNVWYLGEIAYNFRYDDEGNFIGTDTDGSWIADGIEVFPGYLMPAPKLLKALEDGYYQEFAPGIAEDQGDVISLDAKVEIDIGSFRGVLQTFDTSQLDPNALEFKYYEPGIGQILAEEDLDEEGVPELSVELLGVRQVTEDQYHGYRGRHVKDRCDDDLKDVIVREPIDLGDFEQPELADFAAGAPGRYVTYLGGDTESNNALGGYSFDLASGAIGEAFIVFAEMEDLEIGEEVFVELEDGQGLGLFLLSDGAELGLDLSAFEDGGLTLRNVASEEEANINDRLAPQFLVEDTVLPLPGFHALDVDTEDDFNLLNPGAGIQAVELEGESDDEVLVLGFEDMFATDPAFEADFDDAAVAVSEAQLGAFALADLVDDLGLESGEALFL